MKKLIFEGGFKQSVSVAVVGETYTDIIHSDQCTQTENGPSAKVEVELYSKGFAEARVNGNPVRNRNRVKMVVTEYRHEWGKSYESWQWDGQEWQHCGDMQNEWIALLLLSAQIKQ